ncbi:putative pectate lyase P18 [Zea mays]|uniref:Putative pectate lyase P18 n=1 Tax=Zea mays TaxID=4577 RepID=A0A3L6FQA3_MAIZE|nr:putative pectate lyase P18 [Zea mays]
MGSMAITVSNNYFTHHNKWLDFSCNGEGQDNAGDSYVEDKAMHVTVAFNHFCEGLIHRMPRISMVLVSSVGMATSML